MNQIKARKYLSYQTRNLESFARNFHLNADQTLRIRAVASVLPFRINNYVAEELIDWDDIPNDPIFQLTVPQEGMLAANDFDKMLRLLRDDATDVVVQEAARAIQLRMNPHPGRQMDLNVPMVDDMRLPGIQHKYTHSILFFPAEGQTCHAYCTYCFRWAQFVGIESLKFVSRESETLVAYLHQHPLVNDVIFTGGDPLVMRAHILRKYIEPLLSPELEQVQSIRIGSKAPAIWPYRFLADNDADDLLRLFEEVVNSGRHLSVMAHYSHPRELSTPAAEAAVQRIRSTGAVVRCQAPIVRMVNDDSQVWIDLWRKQVRLGAIPYYMFVARDTGPHQYFKVPLIRALSIFQQASGTISGLGRTVRGPTMSTAQGKVLIDGVTTVGGETVFVLKFIHARETELVNRIFLAKFDPDAFWIDQLHPASEGDAALFENEAFLPPGLVRNVLIQQEAF